MCHCDTISIMCCYLCFVSAQAVWSMSNAERQNLINFLLAEISRAIIPYYFSFTRMVKLHVYIFFSMILAAISCLNDIISTLHYIA